MAIPSAGGFSTADINNELGRASGAAFNTNDSSVLTLANTAVGGALVTSNLQGRLCEELTVVVGQSSTRYGFLQFNAGSVSPSTYRGDNIEHLLTINGSGFEFTAQITVAAPLPDNYLTHIEFDNESMVLSYYSHSHFSAANITLTSVAGIEPWDASDLGISKSIKMYGDA